MNLVYNPNIKSFDLHNNDDGNMVLKCFFDGIAGIFNKITKFSSFNKNTKTK